MAQFRMEKYGAGISALTLGLPAPAQGKTVLYLWTDGVPVQLASSNEAAVKVAEVVAEGDSALKFRLIPVGPGSSQITAKLTKDVPPWKAGGDFSAPLAIDVKRTAAGAMKVDLLKQLLANSADAKRLKTYQEIVDPRNNIEGGDNLRHPYNQEGVNEQGSPKRHSDTLTCGTEVENFANKYLGGSSLNYYSYNKPGTAGVMTARKNLTYANGYLERAMNALVRLLDKGTAARVATIHGDFSYTKGGYITPQHYVTIVGYSGEGASMQFLYIDPWPGGSQLDYLKADGTVVKSQFMGLFEVSDRKTLIQSPVSYGSFAGEGALEIFAGPV